LKEKCNLEEILERGGSIKYVVGAGGGGEPAIWPCKKEKVSGGQRKRAGGANPRNSPNPPSKMLLPLESIKRGTTKSSRA